MNGFTNASTKKFFEECEDSVDRRVLAGIAAVLKEQRDELACLNFNDKHDYNATKDALRKLEDCISQLRMVVRDAKPYSKQEVGLVG